MNVSATPPFKPPLTLDGSASISQRPNAPLNGKAGSISATPIPPRTADDEIKSPRSERPSVTDTPTPDEAPDDMFNVDGLLSEWGRNPDSPYDLDGSGEVDGWDLALFLGGERPRTGEPVYNVQGLLDQWGQSDSPYDLDSNGNVDGWDLALFLGGQRPGDAAPGANDASNAAQGAPAAGEDSSNVVTGGSADATSLGGAAPISGPGETAAATDAQTAERFRDRDPEGFIDRFARAVFRGAGIRPGMEIPIEQMRLADADKARIDPDGNGFAKAGDLGELVQRDVANRLEAGENFSARHAIEEWIARIGNPVQNQELVSRPGRDGPHDSRREAALARLSSFVSNRLDNAGFDHRPPRNLHAVLERLDLSDGDRSALLKQLADKYPNGLGVNRVG